MIFLFEDRKGRMQQYFKNELNSSYIKEAILECGPNNIEDYINEHFKDAKCILFHKSYSFPNTSMTGEIVKQAFIIKGVPFVYFSGGLNNNLLFEKNTQTGTVNSGDMYNNLIVFIEEFKTKDKVNVPLLIYGKKYLLNSLLGLQHKLNQYLFSLSSNKILDIGEIFKIRQIIESRINENELSGDKTKLIEWIEKHKDKQDLTVQIIKSQIQKLIDRY
jgi:hypothetical protein